MGLFSSSTQLDSFETLFVDQLQDLYDAEQRLLKALPQMAAAASHQELKAAFDLHEQQTKNHVKRLEQVFQLLGRTAEAKTCYAMKGLLDEGQEVVSAGGDPMVKDAALIAAAQRVEHYEISGYGTARTFALRLNQGEAARLLQETLNEEKFTDDKLTRMAEQGINADAVRS